MMDSVSKKRPQMLTRKDIGDDQHYRSCKLISNGNLLGTNIEMEIPTLIVRLTEDHDPAQRFILFAIVGLEGIGKTAIARRIFEDQRTRSAFSVRLWVSISKGSTVAEVLSATCAAIEGHLKGAKTRKEIRMLLDDRIGGRRIFLVFNLYDGLPSEESSYNTEIYGNLIEVLKEFHHASQGSRVLITTSDENVCKSIKSAQVQKAAEPYGVQVHRYGELTIEDGWTLLLQACLEQAKVTPDLKDIGLGIVQRCNGLPLAIKVVGGVLARKRYEPEEWKGVRDSSAFSLKDPTTGSEAAVSSSIYLSYQDARPSLKQCFIYLSLFPLNFKIEKHVVTQLWISEDLLHDTVRQETTDQQQNNGRQEGSNRHQNNNTNNNSEDRTAQEQDIISLSRDTSNGRNNVSVQVSMHEDSIVSSEQERKHSAAPSPRQIVEDPSSSGGEPPLEGTTALPLGSSSGRSSSQERVNTRSDASGSTEGKADLLFEELVERGLLQRDSNNPNCFKMHQEVRKIAESLTENEAFAGDPNDVAKLSSETLRRLSLVNRGLAAIPEDVTRLTNLRTLLLSGNPLVGEKDQLDVTVFKELKLLRVLDLSDTEISSVPRTLGNLVYLRHLNLSRTNIKVLPEFIGNLRRLRFLGLQECKHLRTLPKSIQKLQKLEHLNLQDSSEIATTSLPKLQNLLCLTFLHGFVVDSSAGWPLEELHNMSRLASLQIKIGKALNSGDGHEPRSASRKRLGWSTSPSQPAPAPNQPPPREQASTASPVPPPPHQPQPASSRDADGVLKKKDNLRYLELKCSHTVTDAETSSSPEEERKRLQKLQREQETLGKLFVQLHPHQDLDSLSIDGYYGRAFPGWLSSCLDLPKLRRLDLANCGFCVDLPRLCQLTTLEFLGLSNLPKLKRFNVQPEDGSGTPSRFPGLKELRIEDMPILESWSWSASEEEEEEDDDDEQQQQQQLQEEEDIDIDLPLLEKLSLRNCPKLKRLPRGLARCKKLATVEVGGTAQLRSIQNLTVLQELTVKSAPSLAALSNLPRLEVLAVTGCPNLGKVSGANSLRHIHIEEQDERLGRLPRWLEQHAARIETLDLVATVQLLGRCKRNKEDWHIVRKITRVHAYQFPGRVSFFSYTRSNDLFFLYIQKKRKSAGVQEDPVPAPPPAAAAVDQKGASAGPSSSSAEASSSGYAATGEEHAGEHGATDHRKYVDGNFILVWIVGLICTFCVIFNLDASEALSLAILFFITMAAFLKLFLKRISVL